MTPETNIQMATGAETPEKPAKTQAELRQALTKRAERLRLATLKQIDIYEDRLAKGDFDDQEDEPAGSGEKRKLKMRKELLNADKRLDKMKEQLASGEELPQEPILDLETLKTQNKAFLQETFEKWYDDVKSKVEQVPLIVDPKTQNFATLKDVIDATKFGEYTLNPDTQNLDWETLKDKIFIPDDIPASLNGRPLSEVADYLINTYKDKYKFPGLEYWKFMIENPDQVPAQMKDGNPYFNFGSLVRNSDGHWDVPYAFWDGSDWSRNARWLGHDWNAGCRVVLLKI